MDPPDQSRQFLLSLLSGPQITVPKEKLCNYNNIDGCLSESHLFWIMTELGGIKSSIFKEFIDKQNTSYTKYINYI